MKDNKVPTPITPDCSLEICNNSDKRKIIEHPEGEIFLIDGNVLECYPRLQGDLSSDESENLTTEEKQEEVMLFYKNAFFFLSMKDKILKDSRLFLTKVPIQSGLAYSGTVGFRFITLGIYIEWWLNHPEVNFTDESGKCYLVCRVSGSPLSGRNSCTVIAESGEVSTYVFKSFYPVWSSLQEINTRYTKAKETYQAYSLKEAIKILKADTIQ